MTCPSGFIEVDGQCVPNGISLERFTRNNNPIIDSTTKLVRPGSLKKQTDPYGQLKRFGSMLYDAWQDRPDSPKWTPSPLKGAIESAEELITLQFEAGKLISEGRVKGADQYGAIERERVESLGFRPYWTPGGIQA